jgi:hypothetical protein
VPHPSGRLTTEELTPQPEDHEFAKKLVAEGWKQTSRRHRHVSRLPPGMTGVEALRWARREYSKQFDEPYGSSERKQSESEAAITFMRVYSSYKFAAGLCHKVLTVRQFQAFLKVGGQSA